MTNRPRSTVAATSALAFAAAALAPTTPAADQIVTLGDSLTFPYEAEFGFDITIQGFGTFGDGFGPEVKNWIEILSDPAYRGEQFDQGARDEVTIPVSFFPPRTETLFLRRVYNWAIPGLQINDLRRFLNAEIDLLELLGESEEFDLLGTALGLSDFSVDDDFNVIDLIDQLEDEAERAVVFIGGNDANTIYETVYEGGSAGTFVADFVDDMAFILDWVLEKNPAIELVLVGAPHVGITPDVKATHPPDPVKTPRVTAVMADLNHQLAGLAATRGIGFADVFTATLPLLEADPVPVFGVTFANEGSETGDTDFSWLDGELSYNFHPNTNVQALLANEIVHAFNRTYGPEIAPLTATEILGGLLSKAPAEIDLPFEQWAAGYGLPGLAFDDDSDRDGIPAGLEFAMGLDPTTHDSHHVTAGPNRIGPGVAIDYPVRLPGSSQVTLQARTSNDLETFGAAPAPEAQPDGRLRATTPPGDRQGVLRLEAETPGM